MTSIRPLNHFHRRPRSKRIPIALGLLLTFLLGLPQPTWSQDSGSVTGRLTPVPADGFVLATVRINALAIAARVDAEGFFRLGGLRPGSFLLEARVPGLALGSQRIVIQSGETTSVTMKLGPSHHADEIVVTASADDRSPLELAAATLSLDALDLDLRRESSLGETLAQERGIHSTFFGPGASRPVIRGHTGERVRILEGGIGVGDASGFSADHAVTSEPSQAERIEVLRGPSTLRYGSSAIGGVVNIIDERIPSVRGTGGTHGSLEFRLGSGSDEQEGTLELEGAGQEWAWNVATANRRTDDYDIPGFARLEEAGLELDSEHHEEGEEHEEENPFGTVPNTDIRSQSARMGATRFFGDRGLLGISLSGFDTEYGLPGGLPHPEHGEEEDGEHGHLEESGHDEHEEDEVVRIDMQQQRLDLRARVDQPFAGFQAAELRLGVTDYEHIEFEGESQGTLWFHDFLEARLELVQTRSARHGGSVGLQLFDSELEAIGAEAFVPATATRRLALFTLQEFETGDMTWQLGGRFENQDVNPISANAQSHEGASASLGWVWRASDAVSLAASAARSVRLPSASELFSNGLHVGTQAFEFGDPNLQEEVGLGLDLAWRLHTDRVSAEVTLFRQSFADFIFPAFSGEEAEGFPVVVYSQEDATFTGVEVEGRIELLERDGHHLHLTIVADRVEAELDTGSNLPRIPPARIGSSLHYHGERWNAMAEVRWVDRQTDVARNETPTDGFTQVNVGLGYRLPLGYRVLDLLLRGRNLTDEEARSHTSYLKHLAPLPGRQVTLTARFRF